MRCRHLQRGHLLVGGVLPWGRPVRWLERPLTLWASGQDQRRHDHVKPQCGIIWARFHSKRLPLNVPNLPCPRGFLQTGQQLAVDRPKENLHTSFSMLLFLHPSPLPSERFQGFPELFFFICLPSSPNSSLHLSPRFLQIFVTLY